MQFKLRSLKHIDILSPIGRIDSAEASDFENVITTLQDSKRNKIVIDCSQLDYISSAGLRVLVSALKAAKHHNGNVVLYNVNENVRSTLTLVGLQTIFDFYTDLVDAVDSF
jgi:anti-sigma B factor antagonist